MITSHSILFRFHFIIFKFYFLLYFNFTILVAYVNCFNKFISSNDCNLLFLLQMVSSRYLTMWHSKNFSLVIHAVDVVLMILFSSFLHAISSQEPPMYDLLQKTKRSYNLQWPMSHVLSAFSSERWIGAVNFLEKVHFDCVCIHTTGKLVPQKNPFWQAHWRQQPFVLNAHTRHNSTRRCSGAYSNSTVDSACHRTVQNCYHLACLTAIFQKSLIFRW